MTPVNNVVVTPFRILRQCHPRCIAGAAAGDAHDRRAGQSGQNGGEQQNSGSLFHAPLYQSDKADTFTFWTDASSIDGFGVRSTVRTELLMPAKWIASFRVFAFFA